MEEEKVEVKQEQPEQREQINETKEVKQTKETTQAKQVKAEKESKEVKSAQEIQVLINNRKEEEHIKQMAIELIKQTNDQKLMRLIQLSEYLDKFDGKGRPKGVTRSQIRSATAQQISEYIDNIISQNKKALDQCDQLQLYLDSIQGQLFKSKQK